MRAIVMPKLGLTMTDGTVVSWLKKVGESVTSGEPLVEIETDKTTYTIESQTDGTILDILVDAGGEAAVSDTIGWIGELGEEIVNGAHSSSLDKNEQSIEILATPLAKRLAKEAGTNLLKVHGSGPNGRIQSADVDEFLQRLQHTVRPVSSVKPSARINATLVEQIETGGDHLSQSSVETHLETHLMGHSQMRKTIAKRMTESWTTIPHVVLHRRVGIQGLLDARERLVQISSTHISITVFIAYFVSRALEQYAFLNAHYEQDGCRTFRDVNLGVAVSVKDGIIVPIIREANRKSLLKISEEIDTLSDRARDGGLTPDNLEGGTFTLSSLGMFDIDGFTPIILPPQTGILGVGRIISTPQIMDGQLVAVPEITFSLSFDHRAMDGVYGAQFLEYLAKGVAEPLSILL